jgi:hypothetical protein
MNALNIGKYPQIRAQIYGKKLKANARRVLKGCIPKCRTSFRGEPAVPNPDLNCHSDESQNRTFDALYPACFTSLIIFF